MKNKMRTRESVLRQYASGRHNLLIMLIVTAINIIIAFTPADFMLLFSATVPYYAVIFGIVFEIPAFLIFTVVFAAIILALYLLCWIFSKKHLSWMVVALILFAVDTVLLLVLALVLQDGNQIMDILFHGLILFYLIRGTVAGFRLRKMPAEPVVAAGTDPVVTAETVNEES